jgi:hypothetical protein
LSSKEIDSSGQGDSASLVLELFDKVWVGFGALAQFAGVHQEDDFLGHLYEDFLISGLFFKTFAGTASFIEPNAGDEGGVDVVPAESGYAFRAVKGIGFGVKTSSCGDDFHFFQTDQVINDGVGIGDDAVFEVG